MSNPLVSIILPVYNAQDYLKESIDCMLNQTYKNFEFIILNDGSKDDSEKIILSYSDSRIKYHFHANKGLGATLNVGLSLCNGKYIARQDQDDISHPDRLKKQVEYLENNENVLLLGTRAKIFFDNSPKVLYHKHATRPCDLKFDLLFDNPFVHSSVMFRKTAIDKIGFYNTDRNLYEDFELWSRFTKIGDVANLPEVLVDYRDHEKGLSKNFSNFREYTLYNQGLHNIEDLVKISNDSLSDLEALFHWKKEILKGSSIKSLNKSLDLIAEKIIELYPNDKELILKRKKQYLKIIKYRINILKRRQHKSNPFIMLLLKIENKLLGLHQFINND